MEHNSYNDIRNENQYKEDGSIKASMFPFQKNKYKAEARKFVDTEFSQMVTDKIFDITTKNEVLKCVFMLTAVKIMLWKYTNKEESMLVASVNGLKKYLPVIDSIDSELRCSIYLDLLKKKVIQCIENSQDYKTGTSPEEKIIYIIYGNADNLNEMLDIANLYQSQVLFYFYEERNRIMLRIIYGDFVAERDILNLSQCLHYILEQMIGDINMKIKDIELVKYAQRSKYINWYSKQEHFDLLSEFRTIVSQNREKTAVRATVNIEYALKQFAAKESNTFEYQGELGYLCFQKAKYLYLKPLERNSDSEEESYFIKSCQNCSAILNEDAYEWMEAMQGKENIHSMYQFIIKYNRKLIVRRLSFDNTGKGRVVCADINSTFDEFLKFVKCLYQMKMIEIVGVNFSNAIPIAGIRLKREERIPEVTVSSEKVDIVLLGDTPGNPTVGLLYLSSYLVRNGVRAKCRFKDYYYTHEELEKNIIEILNLYRPKFVGVSMKWFPHIYRALEICKIAKKHFPLIKTVLGGDTASFFYKDLIRFDYVDYVIRGDGEIPLLELCKGNLQAPNMVYKDWGNIQYNPVTYVQKSSNSKDIYLSDLSNILLSKDELLENTIVVYTHKGCNMNCIYCSGCASVQKMVFGREKVYYRDTALVRKDIEAVKDYISTFMFDFDMVGENLLEYCRKIWKKVDLSKHFCVIFSLELPSRELIEYACRKFKYVRWNIDVCSLSERHRLDMVEKNLVKPQPTDNQILTFLSICEEFSNIQVDINLISGFPFFTKADIESSNQMLEHILRNYSCFNELNWGRLHAQPGTEIAMHAEQYRMKSHADSFEQFYRYSKMNYQEKYYPTLLNYHYPYIFHDDAEVNAENSIYYQNTIKLMEQYAQHNVMKKIVWNELSYSELDKKSDNIAKALRKRGIVEDKIVALSLEEPIKLIIAIWGVIKSSAAYLVLDTEDKKKRIRYMLEDCGADILICEQNKEQPDKGISIMDFDSAVQNCAFELENRSGKVSMESAVYVIYTSGTTGYPKAVKINRKALNNFIGWRKKEYQYTSNDNTLQLLSPAFDASAGSIYCSLLSGGTLTIIDSMHRKDPKYIAHVIRQERITNFSVIPSLYQQILNMAEKKDLSSMRFVVLGGEKAQSSLIVQSQAKAPNIMLINEYGPTEATITAAFHIGMEQNTTDIIGMPISNTSIYILNQDNNVMPEWIPGELCISGRGVADGYFKLPEVTAQKFQKDPFHADRIMYKTGDIAFRDSEGNLHLIGRMDEQVKISGYRIECGEVEAALMSFPFIKEAVVLSYYSEAGILQLAAFFSTYTSIADMDSLKCQLKEVLPSYMIPTHFQFMDIIPRTISGKVDKVALLSCLAGYDEQEANDREYTEVELCVSKIWKKVLKKNVIELDDNFFDVGGNSILLMKVYEEIDKLFHGSITVIDLFAYPTISSLSEYLMQKNRTYL